MNKPASSQILLMKTHGILTVILCASTCYAKVTTFSLPLSNGRTSNKVINLGSGSPVTCYTAYTQPYTWYANGQWDALVLTGYCPSDNSGSQILFGGGCIYSADLTPINVKNSYPNDPTSYICTFVNSGTAVQTGTYQVSGTCCF